MKLFLASVSIFLSLTCFGQDKVIQQGSYWVRYYNQTQITDKLVFNFHLDERALINPSRQFQLFIHAHLNYLIKPWLEVGAGGNYNWTRSNQNPDLNVPEWRPWQEATFIKPLSRKLQFQFRYRLDERFVHNTASGQELINGYHFNWRHRFRPQLMYAWKRSEGKRDITFRFSNDFMINTGDVKDTFDQNRIYGSIQLPMGKKWSVEIGYMNQFQSRSSDDGFYDRHIIRYTFYHRVDMRKNISG